MPDTTKKTSQAKQPPIPIDPALAAEADRQVTRINTANEDEAGDQWEMGDAYNQVVAKKLYLHKGFKHPRLFFKKLVAAVVESTLTLYAMVAAHFAKPVVQKYHVVPLSLVLKIAPLLHLEIPADPGELVFDIPGKKGAIQKKKLADCSEPDLRALLKSLKAEPPPKVPEPVATTIAHCAGALQKLFGAQSAKKLTIRTRPGKGGGVEVGLLGWFEPQELDAVVDTLLRASQLAPDHLMASAGSTASIPEPVKPAVPPLLSPESLLKLREGAKAFAEKAASMAADIQKLRPVAGPGPEKA